MFGGRRGLLENSRNLCAAGDGRMTVRFAAHNGKRFSERPLLQNQCKGKSKKGKG